MDENNILLNKGGHNQNGPINEAIDKVRPSMDELRDNQSEVGDGQKEVFLIKMLDEQFASNVKLFFIMMENLDKDNIQYWKKADSFSRQFCDIYNIGKK